MSIHGPDIWLTYEEIEVLLESIHAYSRTADNKRCSSGQCDFLRDKLLLLKRDGSTLRMYPSR